MAAQFTPPPQQPQDRRQAPFLVLVALYMLPALLFLGLLIMVAWRQETASAFRYVGF